MTRISEIIDIPRQVHQGDFVLKLTEGVSHAHETLASYVVTPQLVQCFDQALTLIRAATESGGSKGAYLHGSFGSGKSHFMAVLSLLLQGHTAARAVPELAATVSRHNTWTEGKRFLVVPYHLIGALSLESAVLGQYAEYVRTLHPEAPTPGFYRAEALFDDARRLRATMGDERFFAKLGGESGAGEGGWGALDAAWDAESFDAAIAAPPGAEDRARLVGDLVDSFFGAQRDLATNREEGFVSLDEGLVVLSRHARALGYDAVVLFLDELVLWLASHAADPAWVNREGQKVVKLVESARMDRAIPIVSFIARQRDLRELVGEHLPGAHQLAFADVLNYWEARFEQITLEDRNLPAIVKRRLLRPRSDQAAGELERAFVETARVREEVLSTLLTREGDREMFRQVYPFSPALIQTLIAVSALLQRERTALKLLVQLLVDQRDTLELGDLVPVGDLYDVIESGDEPFSQAMKLRFEQAKRLYRAKLLPLLEEQHAVTLEDVEAGRVPPEKARAFRNDARLVKTLILSSLAEGVEALKAITPARLAALNHGTVRTPIPGMESQMVLTKVRGWAARVGEIKVAEDARNPVISVHLVGVDTEGILENAKAFDNYGTRIQKVRALLYEMLGITQEDGLLPPKHRMTWKGTQRETEVLFRNVRELPLDNFEPQDAAWRIVIDYPFDQPGHYPSDDIAKVGRYREEKPPTRTLVWIPAFLTHQAMDELGRLVLLDHVLSGNKLDEYGAHLSQLDREQARVILVNQRDQVRQRIRNFLLTAYGISTLNRDAIDSALDPGTYVHSLDPGLKLQPPVGATLPAALENLFEQALRHQYPAHPEFRGEVRAQGLRRVLEVVRRAVEASDRRVEVDKADREDVYRIAEPLGLGQMGEAHFVLGDAWVRDFDQKRAQDGVSEITVKRVRGWIDRPQARGLPTEVENLVILTYALQTNRTFLLYGGVVEPTLDRMQNELELREEALPAEDAWREAVERASVILGVTVMPLRSAGNVARLAEQAKAIADKDQEALGRYVARLEERTARLEPGEADAPRLRTARAAHAFVAAVATAAREGVVDALARAEIATSAAAMAAARTRAAELCTALERTKWELLSGNGGLPEPFGAQAAATLQRVREALHSDEHVTPLAPALRTAEADALALLQQAARAATPPPPPAEPPPTGTQPPRDDPRPTVTRTSGHKRVKAAEVDQVLTELRREADAAPDAWIDVTWEIQSG
jgi:hypothetical protein